MRTRKFRQFVRDWFCMRVLTYWLRHAEPEQLYDLGGEMVRVAWERDNPDAESGKVYSEIKVWREFTEQAESAELQAGQKWVA